MQAKGIFLFGIVGLVLVFAAYQFMIRPAAKAKPNILVLSTCSMTRDHMGLYGYLERPTTPRLSELLQKKAWIFDNAINGTPWTTLFHETTRIFRKHELTQAGYTTLGDSHQSQVFRVPADPSKKKTWMPQQFNKDLKRLDDLKDLLANPRQQPFFLITHIRYPHFPMVDTFNSDSAWDRFLTEKERDLVRDYLRKPELLAHRIPMQLALTGNPDQIRKRQKNSNLQKASDEELLGLINDDSYLQEWQRQPGYASDLQILRKIYDANLAYLDEKLADFISLSGAHESVKQNTVVVLVGDHGEILGQRGHFTHGTSLYDESVRIPFAVVSPQGPDVSLRVNAQVDIGSIAKMLRGVVKGQSLVGLVEGLGNGDAQPILLRDCSNSQRGVRLGNQLKFIRDLRTGDSYLFDLAKDPEEKINVAAQQPEQVAMMEAMYWSEYSKFKNRNLAHCGSEGLTR